MILYKIVHI